MEATEDISSTTNSPVSRKSRYRSLLDKAEAIQEADNVGLHTVNAVGEILREANAIDNEVKFEDRVSSVDETLLDCLVISSASKSLKRCVEAFDVNTLSYDSVDFADKIRRLVTPEDSDDFQQNDMLRLLGLAREIIPQVPESNYVYGSYDLDKLPTPKPRRQARVAQEKQQKIEPEKVVNVDKEEEGIEQILKVLLEVLKEVYEKNGRSPIGYYDYIIDTENFGNTVENVFYFSFLIRDGRASLDLDSHGHPVIKPMSENNLKKFRDEGGNNTQIITSMSMDIWNKFKKEGYIQRYKARKA